MSDWAVAADGCWVKARAPQASGRTGDWTLDAMVFDAALLAAERFSYRTFGTGQLPNTIGAIAVGRAPRPGEDCLVRVRLVGRDGKKINFELTVYGADGAVLYAADDATFVELTARKPAAAAPAPVETPAPAPIPVAAGGAFDLSRSPMIDSAERMPEGLAARLRLDPASDPFLVQHKLAGRPILPAVIGLEMMLEAARLAGGGKAVVAAHDFDIVAGLRFADDAPRTILATVAMEGPTARVELTEAESRRVLQRLVAEYADAPRQPSAPALDKPTLKYLPMEYLDDAVLYHGPIFRMLKKTIFYRDGGWGLVENRPGSTLTQGRRTEGWMLPAAAFDAGFVTCGVFSAVMYPGRVEIPSGIKRLELADYVPGDGEELVLRHYFLEQKERNSTFDFALHGADGRPVLSIYGFRSVLAGGMPRPMASKAGAAT